MRARGDMAIRLSAAGADELPIPVIRGCILGGYSVWFSGIPFPLFFFSLPSSLHPPQSPPHHVIVCMYVVVYTEQ